MAFGDGREHRRIVIGRTGPGVREHRPAVRGRELPYRLVSRCRDRALVQARVQVDADEAWVLGPPSQLRLRTLVWVEGQGSRQPVPVSLDRGGGGHLACG